MKKRAEQRSVQDTHIASQYSQLHMIARHPGHHLLYMKISHKATNKTGYQYIALPPILHKFLDPAILSGFSAQYNREYGHYYTHVY